MAGEKDARAQHEIFMQKTTHITTCQFRFLLLFGIPCLTLRLVSYIYIYINHDSRFGFLIRHFYPRSRLKASLTNPVCTYDQVA